MVSELTVLIDTPAQIARAASEFLKLIGSFRRFAFYGPMGSGKTTFISAVCKALGVTSDVGSPTFSLVNEYLTEDGETIYHCDLYRINCVEELFDIGYEDYFFSDAWLFIEWPELAEPLLPDHLLKVFIEVLPDGRRKISLA